MILILTGMSCSGKDTIRKEIINKWGFNNMVTYTTRPMRNGEINGKDYIFINEKEFMDKVDNGDIIEYRKYKVYSGDIWYYGSMRVKDLDLDWVGVLDLVGASRFKDKYKDKVKIIEIYTDEKIRDIRIKERGDDINEWNRRKQQDFKDFSEERKQELNINIDYLINNNDNNIENVLKDLWNILYKEN